MHSLRKIFFGALLFPIGLWAGSVDHLRFTSVEGATYQTIVADQGSAELVVSLRDAADQPVLAASTLIVDVEGLDMGVPFTPDLSVDGASFSPTTSITIPMGESETPPFRFRRSVSGMASLRVSVTDGNIYVSHYYFDVLPSGSGFTGLRVRTTSQDAAAGGSSATFTPDRDGVDEGVVFNAVPPPGTSGWELIISTEPSFSTPKVRQYYGYGTQDAYWYGDNQHGRTVPNGTYYARFQIYGGGIVSSTMAVTVQAAGVRGRVVDDMDSPLAEAQVNVYGTGGGGYQITDEDGLFFVNGLKPASSYTVEVRKPGYVTVRLTTTTDASDQPAVDLGDQVLDPAVYLSVRVTVSQAPSRDIYGGVSAHDASFTDNQWGTVHIASGSTASDNGRNASDPEFATETLVAVHAGTEYSVEVNLPDFGRSTTTVTAPTSGTHVITFNMDKKANVYGKVLFPAIVDSPYGGEWVSVDAQKTGVTFPSVWGGAWVPNGNTEGVYTLFGVDPGDYRLRAFAKGFVTSTQTVTVAGGDVGHPATGGADFGTFSTGGQIVVTLAVAGDTTGLPSGGTTGATSCPDEKFAIHLSAYSRTTFMGSGVQACVDKSGTSTGLVIPITGLADGSYDVFTYLPGFELTSSGPVGVTVSGGLGLATLSFVELAGQVRVKATLPPGDSPTLVSYRLTKGQPNSVEKTGGLGPSGETDVGQAVVGGLATGLYSVVVENQNPGRGLSQESVVAVKNGALSEALVDLTVPAYSVTGEISVIGSVVLPSTWSVTVSSVTGLVAAGIVPRVDVYKLPFPNHFDYMNTLTHSVWADVHETSATYRIPALSPGGYFLRVRQDLVLPGAPCEGCMPDPGSPDLANEGTVVYVGTTSLTGVDLPITNGVRVGGVIERPSGDTSTDPRIFKLRLIRRDNYTVWGASVVSSGGSTDFQFSRVAPGSYSLEVTEQGTDARYAAQSVAIDVASADVDVTMALETAGTIVGRLRDADSQTLITAENASQYLPDNFGVAAQANPWVPGGYVEALRNSDGPGFHFDAEGKFRIARLVPGTTYDFRARGYESLDGNSIARGIKTYAPVVIAGLRLSEGQTVDLGVVDLKQGISLRGTIQDSSASPLSNVRVVARPSLKTNGDNWSLQVESFSDENGNFELMGIDRAQRYYDILAAPRFKHDDAYAKLSGPRYAEERRRMIDVNDATKLDDNDFTLTLANGAVTGHVVTIDGGTLLPAFTDGESRAGERGADIVLHLNGAPLDDNPLGEIEERSGPDGTFHIDGLKPGRYTLRAVALGYATTMKTIDVPAGTLDASTLTLEHGATVSGTITKSNGSNVGSNEVDMVVGVDENFEDFLFATMDINDTTQEVEGYSISGFQTDKNYSLVIVTAQDDILEAESGIIFSTATETREVPLVFRARSPKVFVNQTQTPVGENRLTSVRFFVSQPFRRVSASDDDVSTLLTVSSGTGVLSNVTLNSSRDSLTADYLAPSSEASFILNLKFFTNTVDPDSATGDSFYVDKLVTFYSGIAARRSAAISNVTGGDCQLEGEAAGVRFNAGTFDVATSSSVDVEMRVLDALPVAGPAPARRSPALAARKWGPAGYPSVDLFNLARSAAVNPFSSFYDVFLPAGVGHLLKKDAYLTIPYDADVEDPSQLNVYFYDPIHQKYLLENENRTIDTVNHTITVTVGHMSTFMVLQSQAAVIGTATYAGDQVTVFNTPNPFRWGSKTLTLAHAAPADQTQTTEGTMICYNLPAGKTGEVKIEIFDVTGALVRTLSDTASSGATYYYLPWDGRNDAGRVVASGIYLARFTLNGADERTFKMAVLK